MSFRSFLEAGPLDITVEEIGPIQEHAILGNYEDGYKKYRVTFHAPKNQRNWKTGDFSEDVVYVIADSPHTAKKMAQDWIGQRLDPREDQEKPRRVPKTNYLRSTERRHFDMRSRIVGSWRQVVEMLGYAAERRHNTVDFIDEPELEILVDALKGRVKQKLIDGLSEPERKGLRQLLKAAKTSPGQWGGKHGKGAADLAHELTVILWPRRDKDAVESGPAATPVAGPVYGYKNSVYRKKITRRDIDAILKRINTYADVIKEASRLGIPKSELDGVVQMRYEAADREYAEKRLIFADLYKRLHIPSSHDAFGDDHVAKYWTKRKFDWEAYATEVLPTFGLETIRNKPGMEAGYQDDDEYTTWAVDWLWNLYKAGPPRREGTAASRYKEALSEILESVLADKKNKVVKQPYVPGEIWDDEEIPF